MNSVNTTVVGGRAIIRGILALLLLFPALVSAATQVNIGVLAKRGAEKTVERWSATANYLTEQLPGYQFQIIPLDFSEIDGAVRRSEVEFILVNSGIYVQLERKFDVSRIATMKNRVGNKGLSKFGGVIFTRASRSDINSIEDIRKRRLTAVDETSLGGFQMAWRELKSFDIDPYKDLAELRFAGTHDQVVYDVINGKTDVGTVRTDTLERMEEEGKVDLQAIKVLHREGEEHDFRYLHSTQLYPEWPMARLRRTPNELAEQVAIALIKMPEDSRAAMQSQTMGWTIPLNYQGVHRLFMDLALPPYEKKPISWREFVVENWLSVTLLLLGLLVTTALSFILYQTNRKLSFASVGLERARDELECRVQERTHELEEKEQELEVLIENLPSMIFVKDAEDLRFVRFNRAGEKLLGISRKELIGRNDYDLFPKEQADFFTSNDRDVLESGEVKKVDQEEIDTAQGKRILHTRKVSINDEEGRPKFLLGISDDITERVRDQEALRESESLYRSLVETTGTGYLVLDENGHVVDANQEYVRLTGHSAIEEIVNRRVDEWAADYDKERNIEEVKKCLRAGYVRDLQVDYVNGEGGVVPVEVNATVVETQGGKQIIALCRDVSERNRMQELMVQTEKMVSVGGLASGMAHELNNPLGAILQGLQNINRRVAPDSEKNREAARELDLDLKLMADYLEKRGIYRIMQQMSDAGLRASDIVKYMMRFSRSAEVQHSPENLIKLVDSTLSLAAIDYELDTKYSFRTIEVVREYDQSAGEVLCAASEIQQVLLNLFKNAAQALLDKVSGGVRAVITVRIFKKDGMACVEVEDNGPGMSEATRKRVFEPFFTTRRVGEGTGLGLSVAYFIITQEHRGTMSAQSSPGKGATFRVCLPQN